MSPLYIHTLIPHAPYVVCAVAKTQKLGGRFSALETIAHWLCSATTRTPLQKLAGLYTNGATARNQDAWNFQTTSSLYHHLNGIFQCQIIREHLARLTFRRAPCTPRTEIKFKCKLLQMIGSY